MFIPLSQAVAQAHRRLFPDEPYQDLRTLQAIALALTELVPMYWQDARTGERHELIEPELAAAAFTAAAMKVLCVPKRRFEAALATMQVTSLDAPASIRRPLQVDDELGVSVRVAPGEDFLAR